MKRRSKPLPALPALAALALGLAPAAAQAYCRTAACPAHDTAWQVCTPPSADGSDCGEPLWWRSRCIGFSLQKDASSQVNLETAQQVFEEAFATWMNASCATGGHPTIAVEYQGPVECAVQEYNKEKGNANIIMFRDDSWPYGPGVLALTTVTYNKKSAEIFDADMEVDSSKPLEQALTIGDDDVQFDLPSIATHEVGHFLGIAHSTDKDATMYTNYQKGDTSLRDLNDDDIAAICAAYPPTRPPTTVCDSEPRHGFSGDCGDEQPAGQGGDDVAVKSCAFAVGSAPLSGALLLGLGLCAAAARRRRRPAPAGK